VPEWGTYMLTDPYTNTIVAYGLGSGYGLNLDEIEAALNEPLTETEEDPEAREKRISEALEEIARHEAPSRSEEETATLRARLDRLQEREDLR
jgi:hypothetical protein